jgi:hypothetical protein
LANDRTHLAQGHKQVVGSILSAEYARAGKNFLTPAVHRLALQELLMREKDVAIDEGRLFGNALSLMPLTFNVFGPLPLDHDLAAAVPAAVLNVSGIAAVGRGFCLASK